MTTMLWIALVVGLLALAAFLKWGLPLIRKPNDPAAVGLGVLEQIHNAAQTAVSAVTDHAVSIRSDLTRHALTAVNAAAPIAVAQVASQAVAAYAAQNIAPAVPAPTIDATPPPTAAAPAEPAAPALVGGTITQATSTVEFTQEKAKMATSGLPPLVGDLRQRMYVYLASGAWDADFQKAEPNWQGYINAYARGTADRPGVQTAYAPDYVLMKNKQNRGLWDALGHGHADPLSAQNAALIAGLTASGAIRY